jgi:sulfur-oxidizing protein SoxZ
MAAARLLLPDSLVPGEVVQVRLMIQHDMETGYRQDRDGHPIARNVIRWVSLALGGMEVFRVEPSSGISANPYFEFPLRVTQPGEWLLQWEDEAGVVGELRQALRLP